MPETRRDAFLPNGASHERAGARDEARVAGPLAVVAGSGSGAVLVGEPAAGGVPLDRSGRTNRSNFYARRCSLSEAARSARVGRDPAEDPENRSVRVIERRARHLALQHQHLVTQREDLRIAAIAAGQQQTNTSHDKANNERHRPKHDREPYRRKAV